MKLLSIYSQKVQIEPTDEITMFIPAGMVVSFTQWGHAPIVNGQEFETFDVRCLKMLDNLYSQMEEAIKKKIAESKKAWENLGDADKEYVGSRHKVVKTRDEDYDPVDDEWN